MVEWSKRRIQRIWGQDSPAPRADSGVDAIGPSHDHVVLQSLIPATAAIAVLFVISGAIDLWLLDSTGYSSATPFFGWGTITPTISSITTFLLAAALLLIFLWIVYRPPHSRWANGIAFGVGLICLTRAIIGLIAAPSLYRIESLAIVYLAAGCIFVSLWWLLGFISVSTSIWFTLATRINPAESWHLSVSIIITAASLSLLIWLVRRRFMVDLIHHARARMQFQAELSQRLRLGDIASRISSQFIRAEMAELDQSIEWALSQIGHALQADRAFLCELNYIRRVVETKSEWIQDGIVNPSTAELSIGSLDEIWNMGNHLARKVVCTPCNAKLPRSIAETTEERNFLRLLGVEAFASIPLATSLDHPFGYLGVSCCESRDGWSEDEIAFLRTVGENMLLTVERHEAELALRRSESRFRQLFDANLFTVFFGTVYGKIIDGNGAFFELTGYQRSDLPIPTESLVSESGRSRYWTSISQLVIQGVEPLHEFEILNAAKEPIPVLFGAALLTRTRGEFIAFAIDLREQHAAERTIQELHTELERASRLGIMGEMVAGLAHEIHQPLAAIANYAHGARIRTQRKGLSNQDLIDLFQEIGQLCEQAGSVVGNIRHFVQGRHPAQEPVDVNQWILKSLAMTRFELRERQIETDLTLAPDLPMAMSNVTELTQILLNLILNAAHSMEESPGERRITIRSELSVDGEIDIFVQDKGCGIPPTVLPRLFDQFFTTKDHGLGMGLPLSRSIAESTGGRLDVVETGPQGSTFRVRLVPFIAEDADEQPPDENPSVALGHFEDL